MGKENRGSKAKAAATTRHDEGGREEMGGSNTEGDTIVFFGQAGNRVSYKKSMKKARVSDSPDY